MNKTKSTPNCTYGDGGWNKKTDGFLSAARGGGDSRWFVGSFFNGDDLHFVSADRLQLDGWDSTEGTKDETETNGVEGDPRWGRTENFHWKTELERRQKFYTCVVRIGFSFRNFS
jgi:hypothetical protein